MKIKNILKSNSGEVFVGAAYAVAQLVTAGIVTLAMIMSASNMQTISKANYAMFVQQFGEYSDQVKIDAITILANVGKEGRTINNAQKFYMVANGFKNIEDGANNGVYNYELPTGYVIPESIKNALNIKKDTFTNQEAVAYLIDDSKINGYENKDEVKFYGDSNGKEYHFVTSNGIVFTIPGYSEEQEDGSIRYYITSQGHYYTVVGDSDLKTSVEESIERDVIAERDFNELHGVYSDGINTEKSSVYEAKLKRK